MKSIECKNFTCIGLLEILVNEKAKKDFKFRRVQVVKGYFMEMRELIDNYSESKAIFIDDMVNGYVEKIKDYLDIEDFQESSCYSDLRN